MSAAAADAAAIRRLTLVLGACGFASTFTMRLLDPLIPMLAGEFAYTVPQVAMIATAFSFCYALGQPFWAPSPTRSARRGRFSSASPRCRSCSCSAPSH